MIPRPFLAVSPAAFLLLACGQTDDAATAAGPTEDPTAALIARGDSLEIPGEWSIPPGDPLVHATAGFAKILCARTSSFPGSIRSSRPPTRGSSRPRPSSAAR